MKQLHTGNFHRKGYFMLHQLAGVTIQVAILGSYNCHPYEVGNNNSCYEEADIHCKKCKFEPNLVEVITGKNHLAFITGEMLFSCCFSRKTIMIFSL